jgi:hypothetical protein
VGDYVALVRAGYDPQLVRTGSAHALDENVDDRAAADFDELLRAAGKLQPSPVAGGRDDSDEPA